MRLLELEVENYGVFAHERWDFGSGRLQLICGPNEAGKSTLLQLVRELLFGFPHVSPYRLPSHGGEMAATARMVLADGRQLRFRRRKGRNDPVVGQLEGEAVDEARLTQLLGGASAELYRSVFAFSLQELSAGQRSLQDASLSEALFGGAIGGLSRFQKLRQRLLDEVSQLYSPRATKRTINRLLTECGELDEQLRAAAAQPAEYQKLRRAAGQHEQQIEALQADVQRLRDELQEAQRLHSAWRPYQQMAGLQQRLAECGGELPWDTQQLQRAERLRSRLAELDEQARQLQSDHRQRLQRLGQLQEDPEVLAQQSQIQALQQDVGRIQEFEEALPQRERQLQERRERVCQRLRELQIQWDLARLDKLPNDPQLERRLLRLSAELTELQRQGRQVSEELQRRQRALQAAQAELQQPAAVSPPPPSQPADEFEQRDELQDEPRDEAAVQSEGLAEGLAEDSSTWESWTLDELGADEPPAPAGQAGQPAAAALAPWEQLAELAPQALAAQQRLDALAQRQSQLIEDMHRAREQARQLAPELDADGPAPAPEELQSIRIELQQCGQAVRREQKALGEARRALQGLQEELATRGAHAPPDRRQLHELREQRDFAWSLLLRHFVEGVDQTDAIGRRFQLSPDELAERLGDLVRQADQAADIRQDQADEVARWESQLRTVEQARDRVASSSHRLQSLEQLARAVQSRWQSLWGGHDAQPDTAPQWLRLREQLQAGQREYAQLQQEAEPLRQKVGRFASRAAQALGEAPGDPPGDVHRLAAALQSRVRVAQQHAARRQHLEQTLPELQDQVQDCQQQLAQLQARQRPLQLAWCQMLQQMKLPEEWTAESAPQSLSSLAAARADWERAGELREQVEAMQAERAAFVCRVDRLAAGASRRGESAVQVVHQLVQRLERARQAQQLQENWQAEEAVVDRRTCELRAEQQALRTELAELRQGFDVDDEQFDAALAQWRLRAELVEQEQAARRELLAALAAGTQDSPPQDASARAAQQQIARLQQSDEESLRQRCQQLRQELAVGEQSLGAALQQTGALRQQLQLVDGSDAAAEVALQRQSCLAELAEAVDRWAPLMLAGELMKGALARFERDQQPAILADVARLFERMTGGRYVDVRRQLDTEGTLRVIDMAGHAKRPDQLSTGAREQLYLAIRLAYVRHYCRGAEPLPVVMDDVLVNFDEPRARRTIELLLELSSEVQILLLTCHRTTARLFAQACPGAHPILMTHDPHDSLDLWLSSARPRRRAAPPDGGQGVLFRDQ